MTCPSPITHSMYADGALAAREALLLEQHATTCAACRARIEALRQESAALRLALRHAEDSAPIPRFAPPARARDFVVLVLGIALIGGFSKAFWNTVAAAIPSGLEHNLRGTLEGIAQCTSLRGTHATAARAWVNGRH